MPVMTSTEAGRAIVHGNDRSLEENATAKFHRKREEAQRAADALNGTPAPAPARPVATFTIHGLMDDFPFDVAFSGTADQLAATVTRLRELGAVPPTQAARADVAAEKERSAPICKYHGAMKESTKAPGTFFCPAKMGSGDYCKEKA